MHFTDNEATGCAVVVLTATAAAESGERDASISWITNPNNEHPKESAVLDIASMLNHAPHWFTKAALANIR